MTDLTIGNFKYQGKKAKAIYNYKATMNDELTFIVDEVIVVTQSSEDETWLEGTLNGRTGWFPSNYVELIEDFEQYQMVSESNDSSRQFIDTHSVSDEAFRIKIINEFKRAEEDFLDEMCKFIKIALIPLQANKTVDIFPGQFLNQLNTSIDELLRCHQTFFQQLKEIPEASDAKIGYLLTNMASKIKLVYESYAKNNPKFTNAINKKKDSLAKFFESSFQKMNVSSGNDNSAAVILYLTKYLAAPFKQLETYSKLLKELYRFTEDCHIDRGDVQRSMEFYSELSASVLEIRHKKECELDIMSSKINNVKEDIFQNGESLFLSSVLIISETGKRFDRIILLFPNHFILLSQNQNKPNEFDFESQIPFVSSTQTHQRIIQMKKVTNFDMLSKGYGCGMIDPSSLKYCLEMATTNGSRFLIVCSTNYDLKMLTELLANQLSKIQFSLNNKNLKSQKDVATIPSASILTNSSSFKAGSLTSPVHAKQNTSFKALTGNLSGSILNNSNSHILRTKTFSMRPHPPLIPHFQLPTDLNTSTGVPNNKDQVGDTNQTLKRFMYKKPKLSEPFGKYHGADDDLKLLTVIEAFCKSRVRTSVNINVQEAATSPLNKSLQTSQRTYDLDKNDKKLNKTIKHILRMDLTGDQKTNKELKLLVSNLQKQLEQEKHNRRKLESFIRKELKTNNFSLSSSNINEPAKLVPNVEHESSI